MTTRRAGTFLLVGLLLSGAVALAVWPGATDCHQDEAKVLWTRAKLVALCESVDAVSHAHSIADELDAWGARLRVSVEADLVRVQSAGQDGQFDNDDDVIRQCEPNHAAAADAGRAAERKTGARGERGPRG
jgi:hypothetical protein